jgi:hypothetical protein
MGAGLPRCFESARNDYQVLMNTTILVFYAFACLVVGCTTSKQEKTVSSRSNGDPKLPSQKISSRLSDVNFNDGINAQEARRLADLYFKRVYGGCGMCLAIEDRGAIWYFPCAVGFAGSHRPGISVAKQGCMISCLSKPNVTNPDQLVDARDSIWRGTNRYNIFFGSDR